MIEPVAPSVATPKPPTSQRTIWHKFGKFISAFVIVCFFLPFFGVSCDGVDVITVSGADMVGGCKPGGLLASAGEGEMKGGEVKVEDVDVEPIAIAAFALVIVGFGLSWLKTRKALTGAFVVSILSIGALVALYVKVGSDLDGAIAEELEDEVKKGEGMGGSMKTPEVDAGGRMGLWGSALALLAIAVITGLAMRENETIPESVPPGGPRAGESVY